MASYPHCERAAQYVEDILSGRVSANKWVKAACQRQVDDLHRAAVGDVTFPYHFDYGKAERVCKFISLMPNHKGATGLIHLEDWQCNLICTVYGWVHNETGYRRFRRAYLEIARKNGKTTILAALLLYHLSLDNEEGAEVYCAATKQKQANIAFEIAQTMARKSPEFRTKCGVQVGAHTIFVPRSGSKFEALSSEASTLDGLNVSMACMDELHAHKTREVYEVLDTATGARKQPLIWSITTAGTNLSGICYEVHTDVTKILDGSAKDESFYGIIYSIDDEDDPWDTDCVQKTNGKHDGDCCVWKKANPNLGVSVTIDDLHQKAARAQRSASKQNGFLTKHLNVWCHADTSWLDGVSWRKCADSKLTLDDFEGQPCIVGLDLASKVDLASLVILFRRQETTTITKRDGTDEEKTAHHYYAFQKSYLPERAIEDSDNASYEGWVEDGYITATPGDETDYDYIERDLKELSSRFRIAELCHDPMFAAQLITHLQEEGIEAVTVPQQAKFLSPAMDEVEAAVLSKRFHHPDDPVLNWAISNVVAHRDKNDNVFPNKQRRENKIDPVTALLNAVYRVMLLPEEDPDEIRTFITVIG